MKKLLTILTLFLLAGCTKDTVELKGGKTTFNNGTPVSFNMQVLDRITTQPIAGVSVTPFKCTGYDDAMVCMGSEPMGTMFTDAGGNCVISYQGQIVGLRVSHPAYWDEVSSELKSVINMIPEAWMSVDLRRNVIRKGGLDDYPAGSVMTVSKGYSLMDDHFYSLSFPTPQSDTMILIRCYGGINDRISWKITDEEGAMLKEGLTPEFLVNSGGMGYIVVHF